MSGRRPVYRSLVSCFRSELTVYRFSRLNSQSRAASAPTQKYSAVLLTFPTMNAPPEIADIDTHNTVISFPHSKRLRRARKRRPVTLECVDPILVYFLLSR